MEKKMEATTLCSLIFKIKVYHVFGAWNIDRVVVTPN